MVREMPERQRERKRGETGVCAGIKPILRIGGYDIVNKKIFYRRRNDYDWDNDGKFA